ncbi:metallophosphoesterase [Halobacteriales archaeon Cl-PHB]
MLVVIGDTHGTDGHRLDGAVLEAVRDADLVVHTGDFTTEAVLEALEATAGNLAAVYGNNDGPAIRDRLPATRVVEALGRRWVVAHGHDHAETELGYLAKARDADAVVVGHSHEPGVESVAGVPLVNPGSYADPRWHRPGFVEVRASDGSAVGRLRDPDGTTFHRFRV